MDWAWFAWLLFSFKGRIQRLYWWLTSLVVGAVAGMISSTVKSVAQSFGIGFIDPETHAFEPAVLSASSCLIGSSTCGSTTRSPPSGCMTETAVAGGFSRQPLPSSWP